MMKKLIIAFILLGFAGYSWAWVPSGEVIKVKLSGKQYCNGSTKKLNSNKDIFYAVFFVNQIEFYSYDPTATNGTGPFALLYLTNVNGVPNKQSKLTFYAANAPDRFNAATMIGEITLDKKTGLAKKLKNASIIENGQLFSPPGCYTDATGKGNFVGKLLP